MSSSSSSSSSSALLLAWASFVCLDWLKQTNKESRHLVLFSFFSEIVLVHTAAVPRSVEDVRSHAPCMIRTRYYSYPNGGTRYVRFYGIHYKAISKVWSLLLLFQGVQQSRTPNKKPRLTFTRKQEISGAVIPNKVTVERTLSQNKRPSVWVKFYAWQYEGILQKN